MANNIYIGNRYVPIFADPVEWDNLREYEALTIVTYNGTAYTSRKRVPVGTALSNTEYWVVTGNYNAQVEQYRQEVVGVQNNLDDLSNSVDTRFTGVGNRIDGVVSDIDIINNGTVVCIGDSYLAGWTPDGTTLSWGEFLCNFLGKTMNTDCFKYYQGGAGFNTTNEGNNFGTLLDTASNDSRFNNSDVGLIVVLGGANESGSGITSAINTFMTNAKNYFPNAKVYYGYGSSFISTLAYGVMYVTSAYENALNGGYYMGNLAKFLAPFKDLYYNNDNRHPSESGQKMLAKLVTQCIYGCGISNVNANSVTVAGNIIEYISNDMWCTYAFNGLNISSTVTSHLSSGTNLLATISKNNSYIHKTDNSFYQTSVDGFVHSDKYRKATFKLIFTPSSIEIYDIVLNDTGSNYMSHDIDSAYIAPFKYMLPVELI